MSRGTAQSLTELSLESVFGAARATTEPAPRCGKVDFGRLMMNIRAEDQRFKVKNESSVPVRWQLLCQEARVLRVFSCLWRILVRS